MHVVRLWLMVLGWMSLGDGRTVVDGQGSWRGGGVEGRRGGGAAGGRGGGGGGEGAWAGEVGR
jgi:hypothetical protein